MVVRGKGKETGVMSGASFWFWDGSGIFIHITPIISQFYKKVSQDKNILKTLKLKERISVFRYFSLVSPKQLTVKVLS